MSRSRSGGAALRGYTGFLLLGGLAGCSGGPAPEVPAVPAPVTPVAPNVEPSAKTTVWTTENIRELMPVAPPHDNPVPRPIPALPDYDAALATLGKVIDTWDADPDNPWAIAHGLLARGKDFRLSDGRESVAYLFAYFAEPRTAGTATLLGFPSSHG